MRQDGNWHVALVLTGMQPCPSQPDHHWAWRRPLQLVEGDGSCCLVQLELRRRNSCGTRALQLASSAMTGALAYAGSCWMAAAALISRLPV